MSEENVVETPVEAVEPAPEVAAAEVVEAPVEEAPVSEEVASSEEVPA